VAGAHGLVHSFRHLEHSVAIASVDDEEEYLGVGQAQTLGLELADHLQQLVCPEELLFFVLLKQGTTPHVDPAEVHECALVTPPLRNEGRLAVVLAEVVLALLIKQFGCLGTSLAVLRLLLEVLALKLIHQGRVQRRHNPIFDQAFLFSLRIHLGLFFLDRRERENCIKLASLGALNLLHCVVGDCHCRTEPTFFLIITVLVDGLSRAPFGWLQIALLDFLWCLQRRLE